MASSYPGSLDNFSTSWATGQVIQSATDNNHADAINKIEAELGVNPSGSFATVAARLATAGPRSRIFVAATDATAAEKAGADYQCDGTNDQTEINAAIASLPTVTDSQLSITGGDVVLSSGTFTIGAPIVFQRDRSTLTGAGRGATRIVRAGTWSGANMIIADRLDMATATNRRAVMFVEFRDFTVDGRWAGTQGGMDGIYFRGSRSMLSRIEVYGCNARGLHLKGIDTAERGSAGWWTLYGTGVFECKVYENGQGGVWFDSGSGDSGITHCEIFENAGPGVHVADIVNWITHCYIWGNRDNGTDAATYPGNGIRVAANSGRMNILANKIEQNRHGVAFIAGSQFNLVGNVLNGNSFHKTGSSDAASGAGVNNSAWFSGTANYNQTDEIYLGGSTSVNITNNVIDGSIYGTGTGTDQSRYGINNSGGSNIKIADNYIGASTFATGAINFNNGGATHQIKENNGLVTDAEGRSTIGASATSVAVTFSPAMTYSPTPANGFRWFFAPEADPTAAMSFWATSITASGFTLNCRPAAPAGGLGVMWSVHGIRNPQ